MIKRHELIPSEAMGRRVHLWCFGHFGAPVLVFPSAAGFAHEWDAQGMVKLLAPLIQKGAIKLYCPESNVSRAWTDKQTHPSEKIKHHLVYEQFLMQELVPWIRNDCRSEKIPIAVTGCSLGGFYAANFALKFPHVFNYALCMSGRYDALQFTGGFSNHEIYFNNPLGYIPALEGDALRHVQSHTMITLVCGQGAFEEGCIEETVALGKWLQNKNIPNFIDIWGKESRHDWMWWKKQAWKHLNKVFG